MGFSMPASKRGCTLAGPKATSYIMSSPWTALQYQAHFWIFTMMYHRHVSDLSLFWNWSEFSWPEYQSQDIFKDEQRLWVDSTFETKAERFLYVNRIRVNMWLNPYENAYHAETSARNFRRAFMDSVKPLHGLNITTATIFGACSTC